MAVELTPLDSGVCRVGRTECTPDNGSYGVATLLREHVRLAGDRTASGRQGSDTDEQRDTVDRSVIRLVRAAGK
ncbi:hypothetical protein ACFXPS_25885 [Nocardia sp. NPDC059091]|uniref:hypothetical protein n=1 Tax=unclassified Nocardia TaxID=2637762 RepID=UPI0036CB4342